MVDGGAGTDTLHVFGSNIGNVAITSVEVLRLESGGATGTLAQFDAFDRIEMVGSGSLTISAGGSADLSDELGSQSVRVAVNTTAGVSLVMGTGNDWVSGSSRFSGNDTLDGGAGNDALWGLDGNDLLIGGAGNDTLFGLSGDDTLLGGDGDDRIGDFASSGLPEPSGITAVDAGAGNDRVDMIFASAGSSANGGAGTDILYAVDNDLSVFTLRGFETLAMTGTVAGTAAQFEGFTTISASALSVDGSASSEPTLRLVGTGTANLADELGSQGITVLASHLGNIVVTGAGNDMLMGGTGRDQLTGGLGADLLAGDAGNDKLTGGEGADGLAGGAGRDVLTGGAGADEFLFDMSALSAGSADRIADFVSGEDRVVLDGVAFDALGERIDAGEFCLGTRALERDDHLIYDQATGKLFYDADGSDAGGKLLLATLVPGTALAANDVGLWFLPLIEF